MPILFWGAFFGFLATMFINVAKVVVVVIKAVVPIIARVFNFVGKVLVRVGQAVGRFARSIANAASSLWTNVLKPAIDTLVRWFQKFREFLNKVFQPLIDAIEWVNTWLDKIWSKVIEPILDVIEKIRLIFRLLGELGLDWARGIDRFLQQLETRIFTAFQEVRSWVNTIELWLDILLDPGGWIKSTPFLYTVFKWGGNILHIMTKLGLDPLAPARIEEHRNRFPPVPVNATAEKFKLGQFTEHPGIQQAAARFRSGDAGSL